MRAIIQGMAGGDQRANGARHRIALIQTGYPSVGHLRMARADWAIPQANCVCAVNVPVGGANEETLEQTPPSSP